MLRFIFCSTVLLGFSALAFAQDKAPAIAPDPAPYYSVYLIGDAGEDTLPGATLRQLGAMLEKDPQSAVVFLGDNVYPHGLDPQDGSAASRISAKKLSTQFSVLGNYYGKTYMIPGNHDWKNGRWQGLEYIKREGAFVNDYLKNNTPVANKVDGGFYPKQGLPGPCSVLVKEGETNGFVPIRLVFIDTQWWLQSAFFHSVGRVGAQTKKSMEQHFFERLDSTLNDASRKGERVVLCMHHPLYSNGFHASSMQPVRFLANMGLLQPLGILGLNRFLMQNIPQPRYQRMRARLLLLIEKHKNLVIASGHDHDLEYFQVHDNHFIVSGAGSKLREMGTGKTASIFAAGPQHGFFKLSFYAGNKMRIDVWSSDKQEMIYTFIEP